MIKKEFNNDEKRNFSNDKDAGRYEPPASDGTDEKKWRKATPEEISQPKSSREPIRGGGRSVNPGRRTHGETARRGGSGSSH